MLKAMIEHEFSPGLVVYQLSPHRPDTSPQRGSKHSIIRHIKRFCRVFTLRPVVAQMERRTRAKPIDMFSLLKQKRIPYITVAQHNDPESHAALREFRPELIVLGGASRIRSHILSVPSIGTINIHPGLLPKYRGQSVVAWALWKGDPVGVTAHFVDTGLDTGPIIATRQLTSAFTTVWDAQNKAEQLAAEVLIDVLCGLTSGLGFTLAKQTGKYPIYRPMGAWRITALNAKLAGQRILSRVISLRPKYLQGRLP